MCRDQGVYDTVDISAGQIVAFKLVCRHIKSSFVRFDQRIDDAGRDDAAQTHPDKRKQPDFDACCKVADPKCNRHKRKQKDACRDDSNDWCTPSRGNNPTLTPAARALIQSVTGTNVNKKTSARMIKMMMIIGNVATNSKLIYDSSLNLSFAISRTPMRMPSTKMILTGLLASI